MSKESFKDFYKEHIANEPERYGRAGCEFTYNHQQKKIDELQEENKLFSERFSDINKECLRLEKIVKELKGE